MSIAISSRRLAAGNDYFADESPESAGPDTIENLRPNDHIKPVTTAEESSHERLLKKHVPAWVVSGALHVVMVITLILVQLLFPQRKASPDSDLQLTVVNDKEADEKPPNFNNEDVGLDFQLPRATTADKLDDVNVKDKTDAVENPGADAALKDIKLDFTPSPGVGSDNAANAGAKSDTGAGKTGSGLGNEFPINPGFQGRGGSTKSKLIEEGGGNTESEAAVARALAWLSRQQRQNGSWTFEDLYAIDTHGATGMALLPFLAAGFTHKAAKDNKYDKVVANGLKFLMSRQQPDGGFVRSDARVISIGTMYSHAIATLALCEAYGMTGDANLKGPAQRAVNFIVESQGVDGSWGYQPKTPGDTSIVGWQLQALQSAKMCKNLRVNERCIERARKFLDEVATTTNPNTSNSLRGVPTASLTSIGLLCRVYHDGWGQSNPGMVNGVEYLLTQPPNKENTDIYYYYYATQVVHYFGGKAWHGNWNPKIRNLLVETQVKNGDKDYGSWEPDSNVFGIAAGRLGQTCLSTLTLEVYYRFLPTYTERARGAAGENEKLK